MCELCAPQLTRRNALKAGGVSAIGLASGWRPKRPLTSASDDVEVTSGLRIRPRSAWASADLVPGRLVAEQDVRFLLVHHTATSSDYQQDEVADTIRQIFRFHTGPEKRWPDVCYNFLIDRYGTVWEARSGSISGAVTVDATGGSQGFAQLVCLIGDFTSVMPTDEALTSLAHVLAWLADRHGVDTSPHVQVSFESRGSNRWPRGINVTTATIAGHRDMSSTACPGDTFYPFVRDNLAEAVTKYRTESTAPSIPTSSAAASAASDPLATEATMVPSVSNPSPVTPEEAVAPELQPPPPTGSRVGDKRLGSAELVLGAALIVSGITGVVTLRHRSRGRSLNGSLAPNDETQV
jgi:N-acetylmuramoyl-L-alanine amidase